MTPLQWMKNSPKKWEKANAMCSEFKNSYYLKKEKSSKKQNRWNCSLLVPIISYKFFLYSCTKKTKEILKSHIKFLNTISRMKIPLGEFHLGELSLFERANKKMTSKKCWKTNKFRYRFWQFFVKRFYTLLKAF